MSIILSQQLTRYFDEYSSLDVTFTKDVIKATRLVPKQVFLKCLGYQWPCIIYSSSMTSAKIIVNAKLAIEEVTKKANNMVSLRFSFQTDKPDPVSFYVSARIAGFSPYGAANPGLKIIALTFTQRPADDLIGALGELLEANVNSKKRKDDRIILTSEIRGKMGLKAKETTLIVQGVPRKALIRDLSFSGAKVIIVGVAKFMVGKDVVMHMELEEDNEIISLEGTILRSEPVEGRKDISAFAIQYKEAAVPLRYKLLINDFLRQMSKNKSFVAAQPVQPQRPPAVNPPPSAEAPAAPQQNPADGAASPPSRAG